MNEINLRNIREEITKYIEKATLDDRVIKALIHKNEFIPKECELWDYKRQYGSDTLSLAKTLLQIVSFYNTYGGYIIYGVEEVSNDMKFIPTKMKKEDFKLKQLQQQLKNYTGEIIDISYKEFDLSLGSLNFNLGVLHIPKRNRDNQPVFFWKNGPEDQKGRCIFHKDEAYFRQNDNCVPARSKNDFQLLFGRRQNPFLWDLTSKIESTKISDLILDHNLPDRNFICSKFIGRDNMIRELWQWLGDEFVYAKVLAGDGGKGKTSIAYEFAEEVCRIKPYNFEKLIWLTAKSKQFKSSIDQYVNVPETHFYDLESLLKVLCSELAILDEEIENVSIPLLKKLLKNALLEISSLIIIDDVDSTELDHQKMILEAALQIANPRARFLLTTRMNFSYSTASCITVGGFEKEEYRLYVNSLLERYCVPNIKTELIDRMHKVTDGSPLFTESLLRLYVTGINLDKSIKDWKGKLGSEVRKAALLREIDVLSYESQRVLLTCSYMRVASYTELKQVTGYNDERMHKCINELKALYLLSAPEIIKEEPRFKVSNNIVNLILENKNHLVKDPRALEKIVDKLKKGRSENKFIGYSSKRVGAAIKQTLALLRESMLDEALETVKVALLDNKNNSNLLLLQGRCFLEKYKSCLDGKYLTLARRFFKEAHDNGQRRYVLYHLWYEGETLSNDPNAEIEVAKLAIEENIPTKIEWLKRRASSYKKLAYGHEQARNFSAAKDDLINCARDINQTLKFLDYYEKKALRDQLYLVTDDIIHLTNKITENVLIRDKRRIIFDEVKQIINYGDYRLKHFKILLDVLSEIYEEFLELEFLSNNQKYMIDQMIKDTGHSLQIKRLNEYEKELELLDITFSKLKNSIYKLFDRK